MSLSPESWAYLIAYVITLAGHLFLAGAVLVGAIVAGAIGLRSNAGEAAREIAEALRSWLPFLLGLAVTFGVAPLLFVQVLYQESFYSANLLLVTRFLALIPALLVGFYLLYLGKGSFVRLRGRLPALALLGAGAAFAFVASTWTESHLLSLSPSSWPQVYLEGAGVMHLAAVPRLAIFFALSLASTGLLLSWLVPTHRGRSAQLAGLGLLLFVPAALWWRAQIDAPGLPGASYRMASLALCGGLALAWLAYARTAMPRLRSLLSVLTAALLVSVLAARECLRLSGADLGLLAERHAQAMARSGSLLFLLFLVLNAGLITWCVHMVVKGLSRGQD